LSDDHLTTEPGQDEIRLLLQLSRWMEGIGVFCIFWNAGVSYTVAWQHGQFNLTSFANVGGLLLAWPLVHRSRRLLLTRGLEPFILSISVALWLLATSFALGNPDSFPITATTAILPIMLAVVGSQRFLKRIMLGSVAVLALAAVLSVALPPLELLSRVALRRIYAGFIPMVLLLGVGLLWAGSTRLKNALRDMGKANRALAESERSLERKVEERTSELAHKNEALEDSQRELALARDAALEASVTKSTFLANMSHELRTPLNAIIGYSEMLQEEARDDGPEAFVSDLDKILTSGRYLLELINGVLDLSKIEAGKMEIFLESVEVAVLVNGVASTVRPLMEKNSNRLEIENGDGLGAIHTDLTKLRQMLLNLLSNASKFTEQGTIRLAARREARDDGDWLTFSVSDTGIGMSSAQMGKIFEAFSQADASTTREYGGTGLGLSITKQFCEMLGGSIEVASEPGKGSTFTVHLPARAPEPKAQTPKQPEAAESAAAPDETGMSGRTVLVIDDDPTARELIARFLRREGFGVVEATGGEEGLRLAREHRPAVITLDVIMPDIDGWTVLGRLQADPLLADTPVILLTMTDDRNLGYALGASEFLTKPIDWQRLGAALERYAADEASPVALVVDDEPNARDMLRRGLEKAGWSVLEATNGREALTRLASSAPHVILLDLMMPEMDGFEFLDEFRKNAAWRAIPVMVVTAKELTAEDRSRLNGGVSRILEKGSLSRHQLLDEVKALVGASLVGQRGDAGRG
jgi:signal transduction histidine kinase/DNA-binding response OmpR family regulator